MHRFLIVSVGSRTGVAGSRQVDVILPGSYSNTEGLPKRPATPVLPLVPLLFSGNPHVVQASTHLFINDGATSTAAYGTSKAVDTIDT